MRSTFACLTTIVLLMGACPAGDDSDTNASDTESGTTDPTGTTDPSTTAPSTTEPSTTEPSTTDPSTTEPSTTDPSTTEPSTTDPATTDPDTSGTDPTDATETTDTDPGTETGTSECPPEQDDDECSLCTKENCCPELMACQANKDCDCVVQCVSEMGIGQQQACLDMCEVKEPPQEATDLQTCVATSGCLQACL